MDLTPALCSHLYWTASGSAVSSSPYLKSDRASVEESDTLTLSHAEPRYCRMKLREKILLLSRLCYIPNKAEPLEWLTGNAYPHREWLCASPGMHIVYTRCSLKSKSFSFVSGSKGNTCNRKYSQWQFSEINLCCTEKQTRPEF